MVVPWWDGGGWCCRRLDLPLLFLSSSSRATLLAGCGVYPSVMRRELWKSGLGGLGDRELAILPSFLLRNRAWDDDGCSLRDGPVRGASCQNAVVEGGSDAGSDNMEARVEEGGLFVMALLFGLAAAHLQHIRSSVEASCHSSM